MIKVVASLILVGIALLLSRIERARLESDILIGTVRAFVQLLAVGYLLDYIFDLRRMEYMLLLLTAMVLVGAFTSSRRAFSKGVGFIVAALGLGVGTALTIGLMIALRIINTEPRFLIPFSGMVIGNSMRACSVLFDRLTSEVRLNRPRIEAALALGATASQAASAPLRSSFKAGMIPILDTVKVVGLIQLPGTMTGMLIAGARPTEAIKYQIVIMYMILCAVSISMSLIILFSRRMYFEPGHRLSEAV
ncbi:MAG: iron export ABC transporter permease subunit FetB [bacterium]